MHHEGALKSLQKADKGLKWGLRARGGTRELKILGAGQIMMD